MLAILFLFVLLFDDPAYKGAATTPGDKVPASGSADGTAAALPISALEAHAGASQHATPQEQQFLAWLSLEGAHFESITLGRSAAGVRGIFAATDINKGDLLVVVPHHVILKLPYSKNDDFCEQGEAMMLALLRRDKQHIPHLDVLPTIEESAVSPDTYHLPRSYWKLLQSDVAEYFIHNQRMGLVQYWQQHKRRLEPLGGSLELLRYALWLTASRTFNFNETHFSLVPLVDMTNHINGCPTLHSDKPCPSNPQEACFIIRAGAPIAAGSEVCNGYGYLRNDEAFFHYGFNLDEAHATELIFVVDRHDASMEALAGIGYRAVTMPPHFAGTRAALDSEMRRLQRRLQLLQRGETKAGSWPRAKQDPDGVILQQVLQWRRLRQLAIQHELERLEQVLQLGVALEDSSGAAQAQPGHQPDEL